MTSYCTAKQPADAVAALERLALACGIRIAEFNSIDLNVSQDSPCFAGFDPSPLLEQAALRIRPP